MTATKQAILTFLYEYLDSSAYQFLSNEIPDEVFDNTTRALYIIESEPEERLEIYCTTPFLGSLTRIELNKERLRYELRAEIVAREFCVRFLSQALCGISTEGTSERSAFLRQLLVKPILSYEAVREAKGHDIEKIRPYLAVGHVITDLCDSEIATGADAYIDALYVDQDNDFADELSRMSFDSLSMMAERLFRFRQ